MRPVCMAVMPLVFVSLIARLVGILLIASFMPRICLRLKDQTLAMG